MYLSVTLLCSLYEYIITSILQYCTSIFILIRYHTFSTVNSLVTKTPLPFEPPRQVGTSLGTSETNERTVKALAAVPVPKSQARVTLTIKWTHAASSLGEANLIEHAPVVRNRNDAVGREHT